MPRACSNDLRERVVRVVEAGQSCRQRRFFLVCHRVRCSSGWRGGVIAYTFLQHCARRGKESPGHRLRRDLPERFGDWKNTHRRFSRWAQSGVFARILNHLASDPDD